MNDEAQDILDFTSEPNSRYGTPLDGKNGSMNGNHRAGSNASFSPVNYRNSLSHSSSHQKGMLQDESTSILDIEAPSSDSAISPASSSHWSNSVPRATYQWMTPRMFLWFVSGFGSLSGLLFGLDVGIISGALLFMNTTFHLTDTQQEVVISMVLVGSFFGSLFCGWMSDVLGRWKSIFIATIAYLFGALLMTFSITSSLWMIYFGRLVIGFAIGVSTLTVTLYLAEIAPAQVRGAIVSVNEVAIVTGIFLSFFLNWALSGLGDDRAWRLSFGISAIPAAVQLCGMFFLPYSPRWLLTKGRHSECISILVRTRGESEARLEYDQLLGSVLDESRHGTLWMRLKELLFSKQMRWPLLVSSMLTFFQQASGQPTVLLYSTKIIKLTGIFPSNSTTLLAALLPGSIKLILTIISSFYLLDHVGRRTLLIIGASLIFCCLVLLGFALLHEPVSIQMGWITLLTITTFLGAYAISYGPISWLYMSEVYPQHLRAMGMSVATTVNWATQAVVSFSFLSAIDAFGPSPVFWTYGAIALIAIGAIYVKVPETKGRSLEDLAVIFQTGSAASSNVAKSYELDVVNINVSNSSNDNSSVALEE